MVKCHVRPPELSPCVLIGTAMTRPRRENTGASAAGEGLGPLRHRPRRGGPPRAGEQPRVHAHRPPRAGAGGRRGPPPHAQLPPLRAVRGGGGCCCCCYGLAARCADRPGLAWRSPNHPHLAHLHTFRLISHEDRQLWLDNICALSFEPAVEGDGGGGGDRAAAFDGGALPTGAVRTQFYKAFNAEGDVVLVRCLCVCVACVLRVRKWR